MNFMRMPLTHSATEGSSNRKLQLPEGATSETVDVPLSLFICVNVLLHVDFVLERSIIFSDYLLYALEVRLGTGLLRGCYLLIYFWFLLFLLLILNTEMGI